MSTYTYVYDDRSVGKYAKYLLKRNFSICRVCWIVGLTFEIVDGGFNDIDIKITDPQGKVIHEAERESSGKYTFGASQSGAYT